MPQRSFQAYDCERTTLLLHEACKPDFIGVTGLHEHQPCHGAEELAMSYIPVLLIVWAAVTACFLGLLAYKGQLTRYEEDQLFLNEAVITHEQTLQSEIVRKVIRIQPFVRVLGVVSAVMTAGIIGIITFDAWQHLK
jgi:hypothetical protein